MAHPELPSRVEDDALQLFRESAEHFRSVIKLLLVRYSFKHSASTFFFCRCSWKSESNFLGPVSLASFPRTH